MGWAKRDRGVLVLVGRVRSSWPVAFPQTGSRYRGNERGNRLDSSTGGTGEVIAGFRVVVDGDGLVETQLLTLPSPSPLLMPSFPGMSGRGNDRSAPPGRSVAVDGFPVPRECSKYGSSRPVAFP